MSRRFARQSASVRHVRRLIWVVVTAVGASFAFAGSALAVEAKPGWEVGTRVYPTNLKPGGKGMVVVEVDNTGAGSTNGTVTVTDALPPGLEAVEANALTQLGQMGNESIEEEYEHEGDFNEKQLEDGGLGSGIARLRVWNCSGTTVVTCTTRPGYQGIQRPIKPGYMGRIGIAVKVVGGPGVGTNHVSVSGGGAPAMAEASNEFTISSTEPGFGLTGFDGWFSNEDGTPDTQAGSHPYSLTLNFSLNAGEGGPTGGGLRNLTIALPPGFVGDPHAVPQCTRQQLLSNLGGEGCPPDTQVGTDVAGIEPHGEVGSADFDLRAPVYNMVPPPGVPAEFAFQLEGALVLVDTGVRSGSDYGISGDVRNIVFKPVFNSLTFWGAPAEEVHSYERCGRTVGYHQGCGFTVGGQVPRPLLTVPTSCEGPLTVRLTAESWKPGEPAVKASFTFHDPEGAPIGFTGCEHLSFNTSLGVAPDTSFADTPAGLTVDVKVPQEGLTQVGSIAASNIKDTTVTLPEGVAINPGQAAGLGACGPAEDGLTTEAEKAEGKEDNGPAALSERLEGRLR